MTPITNNQTLPVVSFIKSTQLPKDTPVVKHLETLLRDSGVVSNGNIDLARIESVKGKFENEYGQYSSEGAIKVETYYGEKSGIWNEQCFAFEIRWEILVKGLPQPIILHHQVKTNIIVPKSNNPEEYERAKNRARSVAMAFQYVIKAAINPNHPDHATMSRLLPNLRTSDTIRVKIDGESGKDFRKRIYRHRDYHTFFKRIFGSTSTPDAVCSIMIGEKGSEVELPVDFDLISRFKKPGQRLVAKARKFQNRPVKTGRANDVDEMRRLETLDFEAVKTINRQELIRRGLHLEQVLSIAKKQIKACQKEFDAQFNEIHSVYSRVLGYRPDIEKLRNRITGLNAANMTREHFHKLKQETCFYQSTFARLEALHKKLHTNQTLLARLGERSDVDAAVHNDERRIHAAGLVADLTYAFAQMLRG